TTEEFRKRINTKALEEEEERPSKPDDNGWLLGKLAHSTGSLHSDEWRGTAADLAARGVIAVYPVSGWRTDLKTADRSQAGARYGLIISIETTAVDVDIYAPVAAQIGVPIAVPLITIS